MSTHCPPRVFRVNEMSVVRRHLNYVYVGRLAA